MQEVRGAILTAIDEPVVVLLEGLCSIALLLEDDGGDTL